MRRSLFVVLCMAFNALFISLYGQENKVRAEQDTIASNSSVLFVADTLTSADLKRLDKDLKIVEDFQPDPTKAVIYSAIFPGLGQIYNKKYWKLPIVYGGFFGVVYAVSWNGSIYGSYRDGYKDIMLDPARRTRWHELVSDPERVLNDAQLLTQTKESIKRKRDNFRRNRDLAIIIGVGLYALCMIDAYVDAQLYNFTVTPDLSMTVAPIVWGPSNYSNSVAVGVQCNIVF